MYWIYLTLFIVIIFTPEMVNRGLFFFGEEEVESVVIFCFGLIGLLLYLAKESTLLRVVSEKLFLQRQTNQIRKDLSQSYSYIGEMNRRFDIVKNSILALPTTTPRPFSQDQTVRYQSVLSAMQLITKTPLLAVLVVDMAAERVLEHAGEEHEFPPALMDAAHLLAAAKFYWEEGEYSVVRAPEEAQGVTAFLVFRKAANRFEDKEVFQILAAEALLLYSLHSAAVVTETVAS